MQTFFHKKVERENGRARERAGGREREREVKIFVPEAGGKTVGDVMGGKIGTLVVDKMHWGRVPYIL